MKQFKANITLVNRSQKHRFANELNRVKPKLSKIENDFISELNDPISIYYGLQKEEDYVPIYHKYNNMYIKICDIYNKHNILCHANIGYFEQEYSPVEKPTGRHMIIQHLKRVLKIN